MGRLGNRGDLADVLGAFCGIGDHVERGLSAVKGRELPVPGDDAVVDRDEDRFPSGRFHQAIDGAGNPRARRENVAFGGDVIGEDGDLLEALAELVDGVQTAERVGEKRARAKAPVGGARRKGERDEENGGGRDPVHLHRAGPLRFFPGDRDAGRAEHARDGTVASARAPALPLR